MRKLLGGITASICFLFGLGASNLRANDLYVCKQSASLAGDVFTFTVSGGNLPGAGVEVKVPVGACVFVVRGGNATYSVVETERPGTVVTAISAVGVNSGHQFNALLASSLTNRSAQVSASRCTTYVYFTNTEEIEGRFTGGGSIFTASEERVTHGFELHCDPSIGPNNLEVNFGGDHFHLQSLTTAYCYKTKSGVFGIVGTGTGLYDNASGYTIHFTFTDAGEPGKNDFASYSITGPNGSVLTASGLLQFGNQQFHPAH
jgi:hypothetical protein